MIRLFPALLVLVGCNTDKDPPGTDKTDETTETGDTGTYTLPEEPPTWQVTGELGNVLAVHTYQSRLDDEEYRVSAVFADALQGFTTPAGCLVDGLCVQSLPTDLDAWLDDENPFDVPSKRFSWNGYEVNVDTISAPLYLDVESGLKYYDFVLEGPPLQFGPNVNFSGLWGTYSSSTDLVVPVLELTEPPLGDNVDFTDGKGMIRWTPGTSGDPYLMIDLDDDVTRVFRLEDDGEYEIDYAELGLGGSETPVVTFSRWSVTETDVNGNTLKLVGVAQERLKSQICDDFPTTNLTAAKGPNSTIHPEFVGVGYHGLIYENTLYDYVNKGTATSATLDFTFYTADQRPICSLSFDASDNTPTTAWVTDTGLPLWQGYEINLPLKVATDCGKLDPSEFGTDSVQTWLTNYTWGFGIGEMSSAFETALSEQFSADWPVLGPTLHSVYITQDGVNASELSFGQNLDLEGCYSATATPDDVIPTGTDLPESAYFGRPLYLIDMIP